MARWLRWVSDPVGGETRERALERAARLIGLSYRGAYALLYRQRRHITEAELLTLARRVRLVLHARRAALRAELAETDRRLAALEAEESCAGGGGVDALLSPVPSPWARWLPRSPASPTASAASPPRRRAAATASGTTIG